MSLVNDLLVGKTDSSQYEDDCRALLGAPPPKLHLQHLPCSGMFCNAAQELPHAVFVYNLAPTALFC